MVWIDEPVLAIVFQKAQTPIILWPPSNRASTDHLTASTR